MRADPLRLPTASPANPSAHAMILVHERDAGNLDEIGLGFLVIAQHSNLWSTIPARTQLNNLTH